MSRVTKRALEAELKALTAEIDASYWRFTRCARGTLAPAEKYARRAEVRLLIEIKAWRRQAVDVNQSK